MEIRELHKDDILACIDIYKLNNNDSTDLWTNMLKNELEATFEPNKFVKPKYFVVELDNKIVGFAGYASCGFDIDGFGFLWCNVHPDHKNKGIGKLLVKQRISSVKEDGGKFILSSQREEVTWHLERFGFEKISENGVYEGDKYYLMRKLL